MITKSHSSAIAIALGVHLKCSLSYVHTVAHFSQEIVSYTQGRSYNKLICYDLISFSF